MAMINTEVTAYVCTKNRYDTTLALCLASIANQTMLPHKVILFDDNNKPIDLREREPYKQIFHLYNTVGLRWEVVYGQKKGQLPNHKTALDIIDTEFIWRIDDDNCCEYNVLKLLFNKITNKVGAIGSSIFIPEWGDVENYSEKFSSDLKDIFSKPNLQWCKFEGIKPVEHLHNSFLFRKSAVKDYVFPELSPVAHREETIFTHAIKRAGYDVLVCGDCITWHLKASGGIRSHNNAKFYDDDEKVFAQKLREWNVTDNTKLIVLDCGLGDTYAFKHILQKLKLKHKNLTLAVCFPEAFIDVMGGINLISIAEAKNILSVEAFDKHNIYRFMIDNRWQKTLVEAFEKLYLS